MPINFLAREEPFTDEEISSLEEAEESECSDPLWKQAKKHRKKAVSLEEYCRRRGIDI